MSPHAIHRALATVLITVTVTACARDTRYVALTAPPPPSAAPRAALYLVGDAGEANSARDSVLSHLRRELDTTTSRHPGLPIVVAFLGDNIYERGARARFRDEDITHLVAQAEALGSSPDVRGVFVPGNHGWSHGSGDERARAAILRQQAWVEEIGRSRDVTFLPRDACPGPAPLTLAGDIHLLFIDTEWLLRDPDDGCGSADAFYQRLETELARRAEGRVVLLSHHPLATGGPHGGNVSLFERAPFIYYFAVKSGLGVQDLTSARYATMRRRLAASFAASGAPPLIHAAGHDHSLQVIGLEGDGRAAYQLVSGSASKRSAARAVDGTRFSSSAHGYMRVVFEAGSTKVAVFAQDRLDGPVRPVFACALSEDAGDTGCREAPRAGAEGS